MHTDKIETTRKEYTTPRLTTHGNVEKLTQGLFGPRDDYFTGNSDSGFVNCDRIQCRGDGRSS